VPFLVSPPFHPFPRTAAEPYNPSTAARRAGVRADHPSSPCPDFSRSELRDLAPKLLHPSTSATVPYLGRIELRPRPPLPISVELRLSMPSSLSRPSSASNRTVVSSSTICSRSPTLSPPESVTTASAVPPRRRAPAPPRPVLAAAEPRRSVGRAPPAGAGAAPPLAALAARRPCSEAEEGAGLGPWQVGPGCQPPFTPFMLSIVILYFG